MDINKKNKIKHLLYWSGLLLVGLIFLFFKFAQFASIDYSAYYYLLRGLQALGLVFIASGIYLHRCESCSILLLGFIFTKTCKSCSGKS